MYFSLCFFFQLDSVHVLPVPVSGVLHRLPSPVSSAAQQGRFYFKSWQSERMLSADVHFQLKNANIIRNVMMASSTQARCSKKTAMASVQLNLSACGSEWRLLIYWLILFNLFLFSLKNNVMSFFCFSFCLQPSWRRLLSHFVVSCGVGGVLSRHNISHSCALGHEGLCLCDRVFFFWKVPSFVFFFVYLFVCSCAKICLFFPQPFPHSNFMSKP